MATKKAACLKVKLVKSTIGSKGPDSNCSGSGSFQNRR